MTAIPQTEQSGNGHEAADARSVAGLRERLGVCYSRLLELHLRVADLQKRLPLMTNQAIAAEAQMLANQERVFLRESAILQLEASNATLQLLERALGGADA